MIYIGIDPGKSGGIAWIGDDGKACAVNMPETDRDVLDVLKEIFREGQCRAVIERVHAMPKQGVTSSFNFGYNFGGLNMALMASEIPFDLVTPQKWQKAMACLTGGDKNVSKRRAQELFPSIRKITHATADALLIAEYARKERL